MRIAFDASAMPARRAGAGVVMYHLGHALAAHAAEHPLLLIDRYGAFDDLSGHEGVTFHRAPAVGRALRFGWEQVRLPAVVRAWGADVLHGLHHALPLRRAAPAAVVTVHDVTFDLLPRRYTLARRWYMRLITRMGLLRTDRVIVPSGWVRDELVRRYRVPRERIHVVPLAAPPWMVRITDEAQLLRVHARYHLPERFLLSVGTLEPGKNRQTLFRAVVELRRRGLSLPLVVVGGRGWLEGDAPPDELGDAARYLGYVPNTDLPALYSLAEAFVFPSLLEGFGLPPLEALACGTPVVSSNRPAMTEVLGDAALYANPRNPGAWADALEKVLTDRALAERLGTAGPSHARRFSWERAAEQTLAVYWAALRGPSPPAPLPSSRERGALGSRELQRLPLVQTDRECE